MENKETKPAEKKKRGRPRFEIDYATVEKLAHIQCTYGEIAAVLGCSVDKLKRDEEFITTYKRGAEGGRKSLRRMQWKLAEKNTSMAIWLGKQYLGQKDTPEIQIGDNGVLQELKEALENVKKD